VSARLTAAWPDALAFGLGLAVAWMFNWKTTDLVWSLWLSSLLVGYAMILQGAFAPAMLRFREGATGPAAYALANGFAAMAFFTLHFGLFHFVQAAILMDFLPLGAPDQFNELETMVEALRRYWWFVPAAAVAARQAFLLPAMPPEPPATSVKGVDIEARKARQSYGSEQMGRPYLNVMRMHLLIFFFAFAHFLDLESFAAYTVAYAAYFFPWRMLHRSQPQPFQSAAGRRDLA
jgi:hypothetical protein